MKQMRFKLVDIDDPNSGYETTLSSFTIGRSTECEIIINDPHISRIQAQVRYEDNRFSIENQGKNPILIKKGVKKGSGLPLTFVRLKIKWGQSKNISNFTLTIYIFAEYVLETIPEYENIIIRETLQRR